jgi:hypothetical protein
VVLVYAVGVVINSAELAFEAPEGSVVCKIFAYIITRNFIIFHR